MDKDQKPTAFLERLKFKEKKNLITLSSKLVIVLIGSGTE